MLSTPIFEQLCRELVGSGEPEEAPVEVAEAGQVQVDLPEARREAPEPVADMSSGREMKPASEENPELEAEPVSDLEVESGAEPEVAEDPDPEAEPEAAADADPEDAWTPPEERVA